MPLGHLVIGQGPETVLVLPDWFGGSAYLAGLGHRVDNARYRYVVVDYRGYGASINEAGDYSIAEMAADAIALADVLGVERFHLVGHSMGGKAAQLLAAKHPRRLKSVVALTPTPPVALDLDAGTRGLLEACVVDVESRKIALNAATGSQYGQGFIDTLATLSMKASAPAAYKAYLQAWTGTDVRPALGVSDFPLHVIVGGSDPFVPEAAMREHVAAAFPKMRLTLLEGIGHYPLLEAPPRTTALLEREFAERA